MRSGGPELEWGAGVGEVCCTAGHRVDVRGMPAPPLRGGYLGIYTYTSVQLFLIPRSRGLFGQGGVGRRHRVNVGLHESEYLWSDGE
jgi:hypothetical protein